MTTPGMLRWLIEAVGSCLAIAAVVYLSQPADAAAVAAIGYVLGMGQLLRASAG